MRGVSRFKSPHLNLRAEFLLELAIADKSLASVGWSFEFPERQGFPIVHTPEPQHVTAALHLKDVEQFCPNRTTLLPLDTRIARHRQFEVAIQFVDLEPSQGTNALAFLKLGRPDFKVRGGSSLIEVAPRSHEIRRKLFRLGSGVPNLTSEQGYTRNERQAEFGRRRRCMAEQHWT